MKNTAKENLRLDELYKKGKPWHKWGPYLSERQWGTVREDYSEHGTAWDYFPHDHARSKVYRWGEDGIAGISDDKQRLCFSLALWNGKDPILKERLFGLTGSEGNHAEDVKELYYYLDSTPSHSYMKHLYKYPQGEYPYEDLVRTNRERSKNEMEYEILDTGVFDNNRYFDVFTEYAKASEEDILIRFRIWNRADTPAEINVLPTLWFRNLWSFGLMDEKPILKLGKPGKDEGVVSAHHPDLGNYYLYFEKSDHLLFTENETNTERLYQIPNSQNFVKDAFHNAVIHNDFEAISEKKEGTKFSPLYKRNIAPGKYLELRLRLSKNEVKGEALSSDYDHIFSIRIEEADEFYASLHHLEKENGMNGNQFSDRLNIQRQAFAGMLWSKQYFNLDIPQWLNGDKNQPAPPESRKNGRNSQWHSLNNEDIISMPDKWEYPWYAAWDLAFHCVPLARLDPEFAKNQLILFLREWYMHPNGQIPAYEWAFGDVNPPVHAWACLQVFKGDKERTGKGDYIFLKRVFSKLLLNFTWWVNRKDARGKNVFEGGFLGLDNIGVFDRSAPMPGGGHLEQADGTAWMAMYCLNMLEMALLICEEDKSFEDVATKFLEHFVYIAESLNRIAEDWTGSWDEEEGFFYDILAMPNGEYFPLKVRSLVGLTTLFAVLRIPDTLLSKVPDFRIRLNWFAEYRKNLSSCQIIDVHKENTDLLLSLTSRDRLERLLSAMLDEKEFLSPGGIRAVSKIHQDPYVINIYGQQFGLKYEPGESSSGLFGGNSNWRGPIWFPMNYLLIQSLREYFTYYEDGLKLECPTGSGQFFNLEEIAEELSERMISIFRKDENGYRPAHGGDERYAKDPHFRDLILFYEYFHGDNCRGVGASHQTGWTGLVADLLSRENISVKMLAGHDLS